VPVLQRDLPSEEIGVKKIQGKERDGCRTLLPLSFDLAIDTLSGEIVVVQDTLLRIGIPRKIPGTDVAVLQSLRPQAMVNCVALKHQQLAGNIVARETHNNYNFARPWALPDPTQQCAREQCEAGRCRFVPLGRDVPTASSGA